MFHHTSSSDIVPVDMNRNSGRSGLTLSGAGRAIASSHSTFGSAPSKGSTSFFSQCDGHRFRHPARFVVAALALALTCMLSSGFSVVNQTAFAASSTQRLAHPSTLAWGSAKHVDSTFDGLASISCPLQEFCAAVDDVGTAFTFNGRHWREYRNVDSSSGGFESVSCGSSKSCWAADGQGFFSHYNGKRWSAPVQHDSSVSGGYSDLGVRLSCPSAKFCAAVDVNGIGLLWRNGKWSRKVVQGIDTFESISCSTDTFCVAGEYSGSVVTYAHSKWSPPRNTKTNEGITQLSCSGTVFCVAGTSGGELMQWHGSSWSPAQQVSTNEVSIVGLWCRNSKYCLAVDGYGETFTWNGSRWKKTAQIGQPTNSINALSCADENFCAAIGSPVGHDGYVYFRTFVPKVKTHSIPDAKIHHAYSVKLHAAGGRSPYVWTLRGGKLPAGLKLTKSGKFQGTPKKAGKFTFTTRVMDVLGESGSRKMKLVVKK